MRLAFWRKGTRVALGPPRTQLEKWLGWTRMVALVAALGLLAFSIGSLLIETSAPNAGGDINVKVEFYTAFEKGGGFITWDFSPSAAAVLRARLDVSGNGVVSDDEVFAYAGMIKDALVRDVLVLRNFEIGGARMDAQVGLVGEALNSSAPAQVHATFSGKWADRDFDMLLGGTSPNLASIGYIGPLKGEVVHEETVIVDAGIATIQAGSGNSHGLRLPGASVVAASGSWSNTSGDVGLPTAHFSRFSAVESAVLLLLPMGVALFLGLGGARRESEATGQRRVERFHRALSALFILLIAAYIAALPGVVVWAGGIGLGVGGLLLAYRVYPADIRPEDVRPPAPKAAEPEPEESADDWPKIMVSAPPGERATGPMVEVLPAALLPQAPVAPEPVPPPAERAPRTPRPPPEPKPSAPAPAEQAPSAAPMKRIRCPGCKTMFEVAATRPLNVPCPHCGRRGVLR